MWNARRRGQATAIAAWLAASCLTAAVPDEIPLPVHPDIALRFVPRDVDREHPIYRTAFDNASAIQDWRLEGGQSMRVGDGKLVLESAAADNHLVCWLKKEIPADFLLEFSVRPQNRDQGLNIVFFNTRGLHGESVFDSSLAPRNGLFKQYHSGDLNNYHVSYWAGGRGVANVRKNRGFRLVATGPDLVVQSPGEAFETVRLYKRGGQIRLTVDDIVSVAYDDDGKTYGPVWTHSGWIGLRQMGHTVRCEYDSLAVFPLQPSR